MEDKFKELLLKYRKGATAGFNTIDWFKVLTLVGGWTVMVNERHTNFTITAPNGESFNLVKQQGYKRVTFYDFAPWAKKQGLMQQVLDKLGMPDIETEREARSVRKEENIGTCACCFGMFKLTKTETKLMVLHGYKRPGYGYIIGNCPGVEFQPYELSCEGTKAMLNLASNHLNALQMKVTKLKAKPEMFVATRFGEPKVIKAADMSDYTYEYNLECEIAHLGWQIKAVQRDIQLLTTKIVSWTLQPLPGAQ